MRWPAWLSTTGRAPDLVCGAADCGAPLRPEARFCGKCGADTASVPAVEAPEAPPWRRPRLWIAVGVVAAAATGIVVWTPIAEASITAPVEAYYKALSEHDGPAAAVAAAHVDDAESVFFETDGLTVGYVGPTDLSYSVDYESEADAADAFDEEINGEVAAVQVDYKLGGTTKRDLAFVTDGPDGWVLTGVSLGLVAAFDDGYASLQIGGAEVDPAGDIVAPPGIYEVKATGHVLYTDYESRVEVDGYVVQSDITEIPYQVRDSILGEVEPLVTAQIDECVAAGPPMDLSRCPWAFTSSYDEKRANDTTWTVEAYPVIEVAIGHGGVVVRTVTPGEVSGTFKVQGIDKTVSATLEPAGSVAVSDAGQVVWTHERS